MESAVAMALLLSVMFGIMECSQAIYFDHYVRYSAEEAARYAMVRGSTWNGSACTTTATEACTATSGDIANLVKSITPFGDASSLSVSTTWTGLTPTGSQCSNANGNNSPGCVVKVTVGYNFSFVMPFMPQNALLLSSTSAVTIAQ